MAKQLNVNLAMTADTNKAKTELKQLQQELDKLMLTAQKSSGKMTLSQDIQKATALAAQLKVQLESATSSTGNLNLTKFNNELRASKTSINDYKNALTALGPAGTQAFSNLATSIMKAEVPLRRSNTMLANFATTLKNTARWQISSSILHGFMGALQGAYGYAQDLNQSLNNIRIVTGQSVDDMARFADQANKAAKALSTTTTAYTDAALIYYQQGLTGKEVTERTDATIKLANVSRQSAEEVSSQMTAIWNNFYDGSKSIEYYADVITALGAATASSSDEIAQGLQKFAAIADTVGLSYEKASAALATVVAETRQSADVVGTAFKTMFARFQGLSLGETLEDGVDLNKYSKALQTVGVEILDANGHLKEMDSILDDTAKRWNQIGEEQRVALAETVAGTRQYAQFMAIMNNYGKIQVNQALAEGSEGTLQQQADIYAESWEAAGKRVKAAAQDIYNDLLDDKFFIKLLNGFEKVLSVVDNFIEGIGGVGPLLTLIGSIVTQVFGNQISAAIRNTINSIHSLTAKGQAEIDAIRQQARDGLLQIATSQMNTGEGQSTSAALNAQAQLQDVVNQKASQLSEEQLKQVQLLLDINNLLGQEAIAAGKAYDEQVKTTQEIEKQIKRESTRGASSGAEINQVVKRMNLLKSAYQQNTDAYDIYAKKLSSTKIDSGNIMTFKDDILSMVDLLRRSKSGNEDFQQSLNNLYTALSKGDIKTAVAEYQNMSTYLDAGVIPSVERLTQALINSGIPTEQAASLAQKLAASLEQEREKADNAADANERVGQSAAELGKKISEMSTPLDLVSTGIVRLSSILMSLNTAINAIKNIGNIISDDSLSTGEKAIQIFSALTMILPLITALIHRSTVAWGSNVAAVLLNKIATSSLIPTKLAATAAEIGLKVATEGTTAAMLASLGVIGLIIAAVGALVFAAIKLFGWLKKISESAYDKQMKQLTSETSSLREELNEASQAAKELKQEFDSYSDIVDKLESCTQGTTEWKEALQAALDKTNELIEKYPQLLTMAGAINPDGTLNRDVFEQFINSESPKNQALQYAQIGQAGAIAQANKYQTGYKTSSNYYQNNEAYGTLASDFYGGLSGIAGTTLVDWNSIKEILENGANKGADAIEEEIRALIPEDAYIDDSIDANIKKLSTEIAAAAPSFSHMQDVVDQGANQVARSIQQSRNNLASRYAANNGISANSAQLYYGGKQGFAAYEAAKERLDTTGDTKDKTDQGAIDLTQEYLTKVRGISSDILDTYTFDIEEKDGKFVYTIKDISGEVVDTLNSESMRLAIAGKEAGDAVQNGFDYITEKFKDSPDALALANSIAAATMNSGGELNVANYLAGLEKEDLAKFNADTLNVEKNTISTDLLDIMGISIDEFNEIAKSLDISGRELVQALLDAATGIQNGTIKGVVTGQRLDISTKGIEASAANIGKIIKDGLKLNDIIEEKDFNTLKDAGIEVDKYFTKMADGTYELTAAAEEFNREAHKATQDKLVENAHQYTNQSKVLSEKYGVAEGVVSYEGMGLGASENVKKAKLEYVQNFADVFSGTENEDYLRILSMSLTDVGELTQKDIDAIVEMTKAINESSVAAQQLAINSATNFSELQDILEGIGLDDTSNLTPEQIDMISIAARNLAINMMNTATSVYELDAAMSEAQTAGAGISSEDKINALVNLASQYDNCAQELDAMKYALANVETEADGSLTKASQEMVDAAEDNLRAATLLGEAAAKHGFDARSLEIQAKAIRDLHPELKLSAEDAARMAIANQRMNKGVTTLNKNFATWKKTLSTASRTSKDFADALAGVEDAVADLLGAEENFELPEVLTNKDNLPHTLSLIEQAANGSQIAINKLGAEVGYAQIDLMTFNEAMRSAFEGEYDTSRFDGAKQNVLDGITAIQNNIGALTSGTISLDQAMGGSSENWVQSLNEMAIATGMSVEQMNGMLNKLGVQAHVEVKSVKQEMEVPTQEEVYLPSGSDTFTYSEIGEDGQVTTHTIDRPRIRKAVIPGAPIKTEGYVQVPQISTDGDPKTVDVSYTGVGGGNAGGGASPSSTGGGGGSKGTKAASHTHNVHRYANEENTAKGLAATYDRIGTAKDHAFGAERIRLMEKELTTLGKLKDAASDYLAAIVGEGNVDKVVKAVYSGKNIGKMIASGELGGTIGADYQSLFSGKDASGKGLEYAAKSGNNEKLVEADYSLAELNRLFESDIQIALDAYGNIQNKDALLYTIDELTNKEADRFAAIVEPTAEQETEHNMRVAYIEALKDRVDQFGETAELIQDKVNDYLDKIYEMQQHNADIITHKLEIQNQLTERGLNQLQNAIKLLGNRIYRDTEAMSSWFKHTTSEREALHKANADAATTAFQDAKARWDLWSQEGGQFNTDAIDSEQALSILDSSKETIQAAFDDIFDEISEVEALFGDTLDYWNEKIEKVTAAMEANANTLEHLQNVLSLLGKGTDYNALGTIISGQLSVAKDAYDVAKDMATASSATYNESLAHYNTLSGEDAEWYKENVLDKAEAQMLEDKANMQAALENVLEKVNAWFENEVNRIFQESEDRLTGKWGSFDALDAAMERQHNLADEYLTKTNQLYETNTLLRKLSQDIDKTDSAAAKAKLKAFSDEIEAMKEQGQLSKAELDIAKARYEVLLAQIALEEAQNAKSTVRLQRDSEGNYGYVYTADQDKVNDAEQNLADKQNDLYNLVLGQTQDYTEKIIQHTQERNAALQELDEQWLNGEITDYDEYLRLREDVTTKYNDLIKTDYENYYRAVGWLNQVGAEGQTEAWTNSFTDILAAQDIYAAEVEKETKDIAAQTDSTMSWLNDQRAYYTDEAKVGNADLKETVDDVTDANKQLTNSLRGDNGLIKQMQTATSAASNLTAQFAVQYSQLLQTANGYKQLIDQIDSYYATIAAYQRAEEAEPEEDTNANNIEEQQTPVDNTSPASTGGGGSAAEFFADVFYGRAGSGSTRQRYFKNKGYSDAEISEYQDIINSYYRQNGNDANAAWRALRSAYGFDTGGYTGEWGNNGKLAFLHQKEIVLNEDDTQKLLDAITLIREISSAIDLRAAASNLATGLSSPYYQSSSSTLEQSVTIHAEFPNATNHSEIEEAFTTLINRAAQYASRQR